MFQVLSSLKAYYSVFMSPFTWWIIVNLSQMHEKWIVNSSPTQQFRKVNNNVTSWLSSTTSGLSVRHSYLEIVLEMIVLDLILLWQGLVYSFSLFCSQNWRLNNTVNDVCFMDFQEWFEYWSQPLEWLLLCCILLSYCQCPYIPKW